MKNKIFIYKSINKYQIKKYIILNLIKKLDFINFLK